MRLTDAAPIVFNLKPERYRGIRCSRFVGLAHHFSADVRRIGWLLVATPSGFADSSAIGALNGTFMPVFWGSVPEQSKRPTAYPFLLVPINKHRKCITAPSDVREL